MIVIETESAETSKSISIVKISTLAAQVSIHKFFSTQYGLIKDHMLINFWKKSCKWLSLMSTWENRYFLAY